MPLWVVIAVAAWVLVALAVWTLCVMAAGAERPEIEGERAFADVPPADPVRRPAHP